MKTSMKLFAPLCTALMAVGVSSCGENNPENQEKGITVSFNTSSMYEELGTADNMKSYLSSHKEFVITDTLLVYNQEGALVSKIGKDSSAPGKQELVLEEIEPGTYTLVLWQSARNNEQNISAWKVSDQESLSSARMTTDGLSFHYWYAFGYASAAVTLKSEAAKVELTPKAAGCTMNVFIDNYSKDLDYTYIAMIGGPYYKGCYLDPSREGEDRWICDKDYSNVCFKMEPDYANDSFFTLTHGEDITMELRGDKADGYEKLSSCPHSNVEIGGCYTVYMDIARKNWQSAYFGSAEGFTAWKADRDAGLLAFDPCLEWGCNVARVEEYARQKQWWANLGSYVNEDGYNKGILVTDNLLEHYIFETEEGNNLYIVYCYSPFGTLPLALAQQHLLQKGFVPAGKIHLADGDFDLYENADNSVKAYIEPREKEDDCDIAFIPANAAGSN